MKKLKGGYRPGSRTYARPSHEHALHLRWLPDELITQIKQVAKRRNMSLTDFVVSLIKRHLAGGAVDEPLGLCPVCKRRRAALSPHAAGREMNMKQQEKAKAKIEAEAETQATTCRHGLRRHPGCISLSGQHVHGSWWLREECLDEECRMRTPGWNLPNVRPKRLDSL